ncbi:phage major capsid protein [Flavobacterium sp. SUN046]|uniref:phage major capsid protein n=1 Tax=Flavobacterium sp. SUN046 TaxID=3002440 RepID=UPI002DBC551D|nr:phage major capsid protein [Flavobacterium sp. SUN046]MEC4050592.1 phage major capsid protein [Flavobacterium sp. SUN046]
MFKYKTDAELEAMSAEARDAYAKEKRDHEANENKKAIDEAVKAAKEEALKTAKEEAEKAIKEAAEASKKQIDDLTAIVEKQGEEIAKGAKTPQGISSANIESFKQQIKEIHEKTSKSGVIGEPIRLKSFTGDDAMGVENFPNAAGSGSITGALASITQYFAQLIPGIFKKPIPTSNILDYCRIEPLNGEQLVTISETRTVNMSVTAEGVEKPVSKASWSASTETAKPVPTLFKTTSQMRKFFPTFVTSFYNTLLSFLDKVIPEVVITKINASGTAFTPVTAQAIYSDPNEYDVIVQAIASLLKLGYVPNVVKVSIFTYSKLKTLRGTTNDAYLLQNYGSVNIVDGTISFGKLKITLDTDPSFADDDFVVGDLSSVIVGLDDNIEYVEAYEGNDLKNNKKSHLLEKYVAVNIPTATRTGIIKDTFTNCKTLLTAA